MYGFEKKSLPKSNDSKNLIEIFSYVCVQMCAWVFFSLSKSQFYPILFAIYLFVIFFFHVKILAMCGIQQWKLNVRGCRFLNTEMHQM